MKLKVTKEEFIDLYNSMTYKELSEHLNVSEDTIYRYVKLLRLSKKKGRPSCTLEFSD